MSLRIEMDGAGDMSECWAEQFNMDSITTNLSIGVAANLGPGTVGLVAYPVTEG